MRIWPLIIALSWLAGCGAPVTPERASAYRLTRAGGPGPLYLIGGTAHPEGFAKAFVELAGGTGARVVLVPFAGGDEQYEPARRALEAAGASVTLLSGAPASREAETAAVHAADGLYCSGGYADRLLAGLEPFREAVLGAWRSGAAIGGTSAGAMIWGDQVIVRGEPADAVRHGLEERAGGLVIRPGLGVLGGTIVDSHFTERSRFYRLFLSAGHYGALGVGLDPETAVTVSPDGAMQVSGGGTVTMLEPSGDAAQVRVLQRGDRATVPAPAP